MQRAFRSEEIEAFERNVPLVNRIKKLAEERAREMSRNLLGFARFRKEWRGKSEGEARKTKERKKDRFRCRFVKFACRWTGKLYFFWWIHLPVSLGRTRENRSGGCGGFPIKIQGKSFSHGCAFLIHRDGGICGNVGRNLEALLASFDRVRIASPRAIRANSNYILYIYI